MTMPSTSPIAQPVRQCSVALTAVRHELFMLPTIYPIGVYGNLTWSPLQHLRFDGHPRRKDSRMRYRTLGGTGIEVSVQCLGAMMFGASGNPDHDDCARIIHAALDPGINFVDTADVYSGGRVRGDRRQGAAGPARRRRAGHEGALPDRRRARTCGGNSRRWIVREVEAEPAPAAHGLDRPVPDPPPGPHDRHRGDAVGAHGPGAGGEDPRVRLLDVPGRGRSWRPTTCRSARGLHRFRTEQPPYSILGRGHRAERAADVPAAGDGRADVGPARVGLPDRQGSARVEPVDLDAGRATLTPFRFDPADPGQRGEVRGAGEADRAGRRARLHAAGAGDGLPRRASRR